MDLDLTAIEDQFGLGTKVGMEAAERIYREGAFSHPGAKLTLDMPLSEDVPRGSRVTGAAFSSSGGEVEGRTRGFWAKESTEVFIEYAISADQSNVRHLGMLFRRSRHSVVPTFWFSLLPCVVCWMFSGSKSCSKSTRMLC
jgi:hypothetical protein